MNFLKETSRPSKRKKKPNASTPQKTSQPKLEHQDQRTQQLTAPLIRRDDLLTIEGIDPRTEMALNSIGIRRFSDFRDHTPQSLSQALEQRTGISIPTETIETQNWCGWAEILAAEETAQPTALSVEQISAKSVDEILSAAIPSEPTPLSDNIPAQNAISNTTVADTITDANKNETETFQPGQNEEMRNGALWIQHAAFTPIEMPPMPNRPATKFLQSEIIIGAEAMEVGAEGTPLCTQVHAVDTATSEHKLLAAQAERLQRSQTDYPVQLEFAVPGIGRYQLHIIAFLLQPEAEIAFYQGPILRVVA
jgi:predicted flap endonuclease-1-like 5' DNA nuclease